jgi:methionine-rich copper-binding protein CopC
MIMKYVIASKAKQSSVPRLRHNSVIPRPWRLCLIASSRALLAMTVMIGFSVPAYALRDLVIVNQSITAPSLPLALVAATPFEGQVLDVVPEKLVLEFSQPIRPDKSVVKVLDMYGMAVETGAVEANGKMLSVVLGKLAPGKYSVKWRVRCRCDDDTEISDNYRFTVR